MSDALLRTTTSLCRRCKRSLPAEVRRQGGRVVMHKSCPEHGPQEVLVSPSAAWYEKTVAYPPTLRPPAFRNQVAQGCPFDCGPCTQHQQKVLLPVVPITSACNLDCPICYTHNKNDGAFHLSESQLRSILSHLREAMPERRIINLTGGEPTQHPQFLRLIELCHEEGIHRVTISTHGLRFLKEESLLERLAQLDARIILSFDSFRSQANRQMLGGDFRDLKLRVLDLLEKHGVVTTLLPVLARGHNDDEVGDFIRLALRKDFILSVELHTMTFTGQGGADFDPASRYTAYDVLCDIERQTGGELTVDDFVPAPAAHPLCYQVCYLLRLGDGTYYPFTRFMEPTDVRTLLAGMLYLEPGPEQESTLQDLISRLWAGALPAPCDKRELVLEALKGMAQKVYAADRSFDERLQLAERDTKAIYLHAHMDEETFDTDRIQQCPVAVREPDGSNVPTCAYNILYRERDTRFMTEPRAPLITLGRGRLARVSA
jgi:uncharacterized radical SAM superfamily Fe-S cluster-containing enzyme